MQSLYFSRNAFILLLAKPSSFSTQEKCKAKTLQGHISFGFAVGLGGYFRGGGGCYYHIMVLFIIKYFLLLFQLFKNKQTLCNISHWFPKAPENRLSGNNHRKQTVKSLGLDFIELFAR